MISPYYAQVIFLSLAKINPRPMCIELLEHSNIDADDDKFFLLLNNTQGNILKPHGRDYAWHIFLQFIPGQVDSVRRWIKNRLTGKEGLITSAYKQIKAAKDRKLNEDLDGGLFTSFFLSLAGYDSLGFSKTDLNKKGLLAMKDRHNQLKDPEPVDWELAFQQDIHAMLLIADDQKKTLKETVKEVRKETKGFIKFITIEKGAVIRKDKRPIEHFGYVDGISQPSFLLSDKNINQRDKLQLKIVLLEDPLSSSPCSFGSYFVFRKLEQNVKKFHERRKEIAARLHNDLPEKLRLALAGAYTIGRFENGTPVTLHGVENGEFNVNDFDYKSDIGNKCPFHAHIRLTNPRADDEVEKKERIVRRGVTYDETGRKKDFSIHPSQGVGLLFMSYQAHLEKQFEKIQDWANRGELGGNTVRDRAIDGVIGQGKRDTPQLWPEIWNGEKLQEKNLIKHVVTLKGGEYFFAPSIPFLESL